MLVLGPRGRIWIAFTVLVATVGALSFALSQGATTQTAEVRINARQLADGRVEFALQQRDGAVWGEHILTSQRFFPANPGHSRWIASTAHRIEIGASPDQAGADMMEGAGGASYETQPVVRTVSTVTTEPAQDRLQYGVETRGELDSGQVQYSHTLNFGDDADYWSTWLTVYGRNQYPSDYPVAEMSIGCLHDYGEPGLYVSFRALKNHDNWPRESAVLNPNPASQEDDGIGLFFDGLGQHKHGFKLSGYRAGSPYAPMTWDNLIADSPASARRFWERTKHKQHLHVELPGVSGPIHIEFSLARVQDNPVQHLLELCAAEEAPQVSATSHAPTTQPATTRPDVDLSTAVTAPIGAGPTGPEPVAATQAQSSGARLIKGIGKADHFGGGTHFCAWLSVSWLNAPSTWEVLIGTSIRYAGLRAPHDLRSGPWDIQLGGRNYEFLISDGNATLTGEDAHALWAYAEPIGSLTISLPVSEDIPAEGGVVDFTFNLISDAAASWSCT